MTPKINNIVIAKQITFEQICHNRHELWLQQSKSIIETHDLLDGKTQPNLIWIYLITMSFPWCVQQTSFNCVNSGHRTRDDLYRSRGIWVDPKFRKTGVAQTLFELTESKAREEGCRLIWSIPRKSALPAYTKFGFETVGDYFDEGMEFGPNIYVRKDLNGFD